MKRVALTLLMSSVSMCGVAQRPQTQVNVLHPSTQVAVSQPQTSVLLAHPLSSATVNHPSALGSTVQPQTAVAVVHPVTTVAVPHPTTTVEVIHPTTQVDVIHPQTTAVTTTPLKTQGGNSNAKAGAKTTSMSDYTPKQAKDFAAAAKAAPLGGGENKLGNATNQAEKDAANKASLLGAQNNQDMNVDPKQNQLKGLEKLLTDRAKQKEKQK